MLVLEEREAILAEIRRRARILNESLIF